MLGFLIFLFIIFILVIILALSGDFEDPARKAGREAEHYATGIIQQALNEDDVLLTNVDLEYNGQRTELDNVIINKYGVFIIEVKYYRGDLTGNEDDYASGVEQLARRAQFNEIDCVIYLRDGRGEQQLKDASELLNVCDYNNIPYATNLATAETLILAIDRGDAADGAGHLEAEHIVIVLVA